MRAGETSLGSSGKRVASGSVVVNSVNRQWREINVKARPADWERLGYLARLSGLSRKTLVGLLIAEYCENPRVLGLK